MRYFSLDQMFGAPMTNFRFTSWKGTEKDSKSLHLIGRTHVLYFCFISSNTTNKISKSKNLIIYRSIFQLLVVWCSTRDQMDSGHKVPSPMRTVLSESVILLFKRINFIFTLLFWIKSLFFWSHSCQVLKHTALECWCNSTFIVARREQFDTIDPALNPSTCHVSLYQLYSHLGEADLDCFCLLWFSLKINKSQL